MHCTANGCQNEIAYKTLRLCQMHYFRLRRTGSCETRKRKYRLSNPAGYQVIYEPDHPLAQKNGYVYEHRKVLYDKLNGTVTPCELCGTVLDWKLCNADHIDEDVTNNAPENLRCLCLQCNTRRSYPPAHTLDHCTSITFEGKTQTAHEWSKDSRVLVCGSTIRNRKRLGMSDTEALFMVKKTHKNSKSMQESWNKVAFRLGD